jgi:hypothetical protein
MTTRTNRRGIVWAIIGGVVLVVGIAALIIASLSNAGTEPAPPSPTNTAPTDPGPTPTTDGEAVVDESVIDRGWAPEPITTDAETYVRAALAAAGTFDTTKAEYEEWIAYLGTWFTPDTRYASEADRQAELEAAKLEMRQTVVLPEAEWDSLAGEDGRVASVTTGDVVFSPVPQDESGDMSIGTADVTITFTRSDGSGGEVSYDEQTRLSVQVLCGEASIPTPDTSQAAGDCKVVRLLSEPVEP